MTINENEFFKEATLRICGSLDFNVALEKTFHYLKRYVPVDTIIAGITSLDEGTIEIVTTVGLFEDEIHPQKITLTPNLMSDISIKNKQLDLGPSARLMDTIEKDRFYRFIFADYPKLMKAAAISLRLKLDGQVIGHLSVMSLNKKYSLKNLSLIQLLNEPFAIALVNYLRYRELLEFEASLTEENEYLKHELYEPSHSEIIGAEFGLKPTMDMVRQVAPLSSHVLVLGETGTGKEVIANAVHQLSKRRDGPFVKLNCGAIPESLIDNEFFGHEKGAFTGALNKKKGRFERADGGTIFLDEIGELPLNVQARLLRVLQEKEIERVGGDGPFGVDVRVIAATSRNLEEMISEMRFREDLYFRIGVFPIYLPPLRERLEDIPLLVHYFIQKKCREIGIRSAPTVASGVIKELQSYHWPGNVRELQNVIERALILNQSGVLQFHDLLPNMKKLKIKAGHSKTTETKSKKQFNLDAFIADHIRNVLMHTGGKVHGNDGAAHLLGMNTSTLIRKMGKLGIPFGRKEKKTIYQKKEPHLYSQ